MGLRKRQTEDENSVGGIYPFNVAGVVFGAGIAGIKVFEIETYNRKDENI